MNPSYIFFVDVDEPHSFVGGLEWWKFTILKTHHGWTKF